MLDKLKELLGEELSAQVQEKLGDVELAIMNDGSVVKAEKHDGLKSDYKALEEKYQSDISEFNNKLEAATANAADYDALKGTLETLKAENTQIAEQYQKELLDVKMDRDIDKLLAKANLDEQYIPLVKSQLNKESLSYDGDNLIGGDDFVKQSQERFPKLFGEIKKVGMDPANGLKTTIGKKAQLIEQYNQAEKAGNARLMMALSNQIKNINE
jgi:predicted nuclease with TOPRIM domain